jgi:hypothetical protein
MNANRQSPDAATCPGMGFFYSVVGLQMTTPERTLTQIVRAGVEEACIAFTTSIALQGFARTKKMFWTRQREHTIEFIHLHVCGSSYGAPMNASVSLRVHTGIRVLNDSFAAAALNGPSSEQASALAARYHLRFNASTGSTFDRCVQDLVRFLNEQGEPWFERFAATNSLIDSAESPLTAPAKAQLFDAINGRANSENIAASLKILGIKKAGT